MLAHGLERGAEPVEGSLIVRIQYIDLTAASVSAATLRWAQQFRFNVRPQRLTIVAEVLDAATGETLARIADLQGGDDERIDIEEKIDAALSQWSDVIASSVARPAAPEQLAALRH